MFSSLGTKLAMRKLGISSDLTKASPFGGNEAAPPKSNNKKGGAVDDLDEGNSSGWPKWMSVKNLPLTVQPWFSPVPPPVPVAADCPKVGEPAPVDTDRKLVLGGGQKVIVVFLRCVGCAFAQKTFLALRTLANKHQFNNLTCIAISHSSQAATQKWLDLIGGAWNVQVLVDEDRAIYAAWGLGLSSVWYYFNPTTQTAAWKEKGWLGARVATSIQRQGTAGSLDAVAAAAPPSSSQQTKKQKGAPAARERVEEEDGDFGGPGTTMGNKWQQGGAFAVDERGVVVWGGKAKSADDLMDFEAGVKALRL